MASKRVLIVGGVAGGASCAARLRRMDERAEIFVFERGGHISFANCGLPYYLGNVIAQRQRLLVATPERFRDFFNVEIRTWHEVKRIDRARRLIEVENLQTGARWTESYDALVLAPGAAPIRPALPGIDLPGVFTLRSMEDADQMHRWIDERGVTRAVVIGAGYIGLEMVENLAARHIGVTLLEACDQIMPVMDAEMVAPLQAELRAKDIDLRLSSGAAAVESGPNDTLYVTSKSGDRFAAGIVVLSAGVRPDARLAQEAGLELGALGGIRVDEQMRTSDPAVWAVGDAVEVRDWITGQWTLCALAGPAVRQARVAADAICGRAGRFRGVQATAVVGVFGLTLAMTGATEKGLRRAGIDFQKSYTHSPNHAEYYPGATPMAIKLLFTPDTGRLLGAQAVGRDGVDKRIDVLSMAIQKGASVYDLEEAELCYAPQYGNSRDPVNIAGFAAANVLRGDVDLAQWDDWQPPGDNADGTPLVLDVRTPAEFTSGSVPGAVNIPLGELRGRMRELPRDRVLWVHCGVGQRSYYAARILRQCGFRVWNVSGGLTTFKALRPR